METVGRKTGEINRILYSSLVDVSRSDGPGVNERGFLRDMSGRFGGRLLAVIPRPTGPMPPELEDVQVEYVPVHGSLRQPLGWMQIRALGLVLLPRAIRRFDPDLVVLRTGSLPLSHFFALRSTGVPYVIKTAGDVTHQRFYSVSPWRRALRRLNDRIFGELLLGAVAIDVVSEDQRDAMVRRFPELVSKVTVIDNGVELDLFSADPSPKERQRFGFADGEVVLGYVGSFPMQRGGKEVIDAISDLRRRYPVKGLIVGDSGERSELERYARSQGVTDVVVIYGHAEYSEVPDLMSAMDIGLSIHRPEERGMSEQKVRQYLASGLAVVGTEASNDFLRGHPFARVVSSHRTAEVVEGAASLVSLGRDGLVHLRTFSRAFARDNLSLAERNDRRITLWRHAIQRKPAPGGPVARGSDSRGG